MEETDIQGDKDNEVSLLDTTQELDFTKTAYEALAAEGRTCLTNLTC